MSKKTVNATVVRNFKDDGTKKRFKEGEPVTLTEGQFINYEAAGLVKASASAAKTAAKSDA